MSIDLLPQFPGQLGFTLHISLGRVCRVQPTDQRRIPPQASAQPRRTHAPTPAPRTPPAPGHSSPRGAGRVVAERAAPGDALKAISTVAPLV